MAKPYAYLDTSTLLAFLLGESTHYEVVRSHYQLFSSGLITSETASALFREKMLPENWNQTSWIYCSLFNPVDLLLSYQADILEKTYLRGADLHHLACASAFFRNQKNRVLVTHDKTMAQAAKSIGFKIETH